MVSRHSRKKGSKADRREAERRKAERRERRKAERRQAERCSQSAAGAKPSHPLTAPGALAHTPGAHAREIWASQPQHPVVQLGDDGVGYCMHPTRPDGCLRVALATATQIPVDQVPDLHLDQRVRAGEDPEEISRDSWARIEQWLSGRGLRLVIHDAVPVDRDRWVGVIGGRVDEAAMAAVGVEMGNADNPFLDHCIVLSYERIVFDPAVSLKPQLPPGMRLPTWQLSQIEYGLSFDRKE